MQISISLQNCFFQFEGPALTSRTIVINRLCMSPELRLLSILVRILRRSMVRIEPIGTKDKDVEQVQVVHRLEVRVHGMGLDRGGSCVGHEGGAGDKTVQISRQPKSA